MTVAAFAARPEWRRSGLKDSKKLTSEQISRHAYALINDKSVHHSLCSIDNECIDRWGLESARQVAFEECLENLRERLGEDFNYSLIVLDGSVVARHVDHISLPKGDDIVPHVSAASVIAKYTRDSWMVTVAHRKYPRYGFDQHVGYGTDEHRKNIARLGMCPLHRRSFKVKPYREKATS